MIRSSVNLVLLEGDVKSAPFIHYLDKGRPVCRFQLTTYHDMDEKGFYNTMFHHLVAWNKLAESIKENISVGDHVQVKGTLRINLVNAADGRKINRVEVEVSEFKIVSKAALSSDSNERNLSTEDVDLKSLFNFPPAKDPNGLPF